MTSKCLLCSSSSSSCLPLVFTDFFVISATFSPSSCLYSFRSLTINVLSLLSFTHLATKLKITQTIDAQIRPYFIDCFCLFLFVFFSLAVSHVEARPSVLNYLITVSICHYHHYCMYEHCKATIIIIIIIKHHILYCSIRYSSLSSTGQLTMCTQCKLLSSSIIITCSSL